MSVGYKNTIFIPLWIGKSYWVSEWRRTCIVSTCDEKIFILLTTGMASFITVSFILRLCSGECSDWLTVGGAFSVTLLVLSAGHTGCAGRKIVTTWIGYFVLVKHSFFLRHHNFWSFSSRSTELRFAKPNCVSKRVFLRWLSFAIWFKPFNFTNMLVCYPPWLAVGLQFSLFLFLLADSQA